MRVKRGLNEGASVWLRESTKEERGTELRSTLTISQGGATPSYYKPDHMRGKGELGPIPQPQRSLQFGAH